MKLTVFILFTACLAANAKGYSQPVTLSEKNVSLEKVFKEIKKQTGYNFLYTLEILDQAGKVNVDVKDATLQQALDKTLQNTGLAYTIVEKTIVIKKAANTTVIITPDLPPPPIDITGRITNEQGEPLAGASVIIKRTGRGDIADAQGDFHLKDVNNGDYIIISFAGYKTQTIKVGSITKFTIVMQVTDNDLDKVVIQAYGTTTQRLATGNITTVRAEQIERQPVMNALAALQGQVAGLVITQTNGYASAPFKVEIRGRSVINGNLPSEPLYIIDGVPLTVLNLGYGGNYASGSTGFIQTSLGSPAGGQSPFFSINPQDIESITVLKDADATAIYGSRGANGVIIITTKRGQAGNPKFDINVYQGVSEVTGRYDLMNTEQFLQMRREAFKNDQVTYGLIPGVTIPDASNAYDLMTWDTTRFTDWQKYLWGNMGYTTDAEISYSGGDRQNTFRISGGYHRETTIMSRSGAEQRGSAQLNYTHKSINQHLSISLTNSYSYAKSDLLYLFGSALEAPDAPPAFDSEGKLNWEGWEPVSSNLGNFASLLLQPYFSKTSFLNSELKLQYEIFNGLNFLAQLGYSTMHNSQEYLIPIVSQNPLNNPSGQSSFGNNNSDNVIIEPQMQYKKVIGKGNLDILIGASNQTSSYDANTTTGTGFNNDNLLRSVTNAPNITGNSNYAQYKYVALFSRIGYNLAKKYLINFSARRDGSSRFGPGKQFGNFGAIGAAWIFSEENWVKEHLHILSFGKLRGSYGLTGSDQINDYGFLSRWAGNDNSSYQNILAYLPLQHANPDLEWQTNYKLEASLDVGFLKDRLSMEITWYRNRCSNQLINYSLPILTGFNRVAANSPATIQNMGYEMILKGKIIDKKNVNWAVNFNVGLNKNKLIAFPNLEQSSYAASYKVGSPLNSIYLLHYTGIDPQTGQYTYEDKNHDGQISTSYNNGNNDFYFKNLSVKFDGGINSDLTYKKLQISLLFTFREQESPSAVNSGLPGLIEQNQSVQVLDRWQKPGDHAKFARYTTLPQISDVAFNSSDGVYSNASYIRLRNVSLSYELPERWIKKASIKRCLIYARAENLFVLTKYNGVDPEITSLGILPPEKIFTAGIQFNF